MQIGMNQDIARIEGLVEEGEAFRSVVRRRRRFYFGMSVAFLVTAIVGFAPSYSTGHSAQGLPIAPLLHFHAFVFTAWLLLLLVQTGLVAAHRTTLHMRLGIVGALLAAVMVPVGIMTAIDAARAGSERPGLPPLVFLVVPLGQIVVFAVFLAAGLWHRRKPELHRRLVLLANVSLVTPALARMPWVGARPILALGLSALFVAAAMLHDRRTRGRVHPVYLWGGLALVLSGPLRIGLAQTAAWRSFAQWLVG